jgi:formamidopyrimidine-DNA glycosylase
MPELPEVETTVNYLKTKVLGRTFVDVWHDWYEFSENKLKGKKILKIWRRAKNIIFDLSEEYCLLVHQKMTGHLLMGEWKFESKKWKPKEAGPLNDPYNRFVHLVLFLDNGQMIALSDARKFAKVQLYKKEELKKELEKLGPEPLEKDFTFNKFMEVLKNKKGRVKQVIMDQEVFAGVGNIYASEALWQAKIYPEKRVEKLSDKELKLLYQAIIKVLEIGVRLGGESFSDYRKPDGTKGNFDSERKAYQREGQKCFRCGTKIKRLIIAQRSSFYCSNCQKL